MKKYLTIFVTIALALCAVSASAETLTVKDFAKLEWNTGKFWSDGASHDGVGTTAMQIELLDAEGNSINGDELFVGFCVDPLQPISKDEEIVVGLTNVENVEGGLEAAWLFDQVYNDALNSKAVAGLQYALWEVTSGDATYDLGTGNFYARITDSSIRDYADTYLEMVATQGMISQDDLNATYLISQTPTNQDLIVRMPKDTPVPTPEPASMLLLGMGLLGLFGLSRKAKK